MSMSGKQTDEAWAKLAELPAPKRETQMLKRYNELTELLEEARQNALLPVAHPEYALPDHKLRDLTLSRMRVLLKMSPAAAKRVAMSYAAMMDRLPSTAALERAALIQSLAKEFSGKDEAQLRSINPNVCGGMPAPDPNAIAQASTPNKGANKK